jgi:hypothetical protein
MGNHYSKPPVMKTLKKISALTVSLILLAFLLVVNLSPYKYNKEHEKKVIVSQVTIKAPAQKIFNYLGISSNASIWSTFVNKIEPINADKVEDGEVGSLRRCYGKQTDIVWDEEILLVNPRLKRVLKILNPKGFPFVVDNLITEQIYKRIDDNNTQLSLTLFSKDKEIDFLSELKLKAGAFVVADIFKANLENIKNQNESEFK